MLFSPITIRENEVETRNDTYLLENLTVVSARRTLLGAGLLVAAALGGFGIAFADILWPAEKIIIAFVCGLSLWAGFSIGRLRFHSRDLHGSELSGVVWGSYGRLNRTRRDIAAAVRAARSGGKP
ncbi:MAG: hypothetical protein GW903_07865 [Alphaproteobacteria bacterium]|nr:hypothetical protein [Alphaproteobacteria bacterium]NCQ89176.1 hypothetical protein [Alphaproteobacteria bacterium]NCT08280.1 hypothetical protein [Alphaproteobacteria bacterium]